MRKFNIQIRTSKGQCTDHFVFDDLQKALDKYNELLLDKSKNYMHLIQLNSILK